MSRKPRVKVNKNEPMILVGFGKHDLGDLMKLIGTEEEEKLVLAPTKYSWPPRYRRSSICTAIEMQTFKEYIEHMSQFIRK